MKRFVKVFLFVLGLVLLTGLTGCETANYEAEAGKYECYYITMNGQNVTSYYEYYNIILEVNGKCVVESKQVGASQTYEAKAKYSIADNKIKVVTSMLFFKVTEEYDYINGEIIMDTTLEDTRVYAKFRRAQ